MGVGRRLREILPYSHGDAQKHGHESVNNSDAQKPSIDIRHIPAFPFTNRDSAEFNLARCSPLNVSLPRLISSLAAVFPSPFRIMITYRVESPVARRISARGYFVISGVKPSL